MSGRSCSRATRVFFLNVTPIRRKKRPINRGGGFDASLGQKANAKRLKLGVRLLGPAASRKSRCGISL
jgi:hypothetical protein